MYHSHGMNATITKIEKMLWKVPQITAGKVFGSFAFVGSTAVDLGDRFRARSVTAHPVGDIGYSTHGWKLAREVA